MEGRDDDTIRLIENEAEWALVAAPPCVLNVA
jgi:hypothetical protein